MLITKTEPVNKTKYAVSIDGEFAFVVYKGELHKYGISENRELAQDVFDEIMEHVLPKRAKLRCMNLLKSREYTRQQMEDKLRQGKYPPSVIAEALAYVESFGYIDDAAYARRYVSAYLERKSRRCMEEELRRKGIDRNGIEEAMRIVQEEDGLQDEEGMIRGISDIEVLYSQKQNYCGIPMVEYVCRGVTQGMRRGFRLFFHLEECIFKIVWE